MCGYTEWEVGGTTDMGQQEGLSPDHDKYLEIGRETRWKTLKGNFLDPGPAEGTLSDS